MNMENVVVRGVSIEKNQAKVTIRRVPDRPGTAARIFCALAEANMIIDMIVQSDSVGDTNDISFTLNKDELTKAQTALGAGRRRISERAELATAGRHRQAQHRGHRHALPQRRGREDVRSPERGRNQHPDDLHQRDQDRRHHSTKPRSPRQRTWCTKRSDSAKPSDRTTTYYLLPRSLPPRRTDRLEK